MLASDYFTGAAQGLTYAISIATRAVSIGIVAYWIRLLLRYC